MSGRKTETTEKELTPVPAAPRKRGRPKRNADATEENKAVNTEPKRKKTSPAVKAEEKKSADNADTAKVQSDVAAAPKKRGRPRKSEAAVAAETSVVNGPVAQSKSQKKPRKTAASAKKQETATDISSKTPQVMRLVQQNNDMVNPTIMAGKSSIPRKLRGLEPLTKIMKREAEEIFGTDQEEETFNLTALVIDDSAAEILRRFNACDCEICIEQLSRLTADIVPARFAKLKRRAVERNSPDVEELKAPLRRSVTSQMIRLVIQNKKRSFHD